MANLQQREQSRSEELFEFPMTGPFGGVQSELPLDQIEAYGFADTTNILFRKGVAFSRPGFTVLPQFGPPSNEAIVGIADFFTRNGVRIQVIMTPTRLFQWNPVNQAFVQITGPGFTGASNNLFGWDVVGNKLCFSQGVDKIWLWDGITPGYVQSSTSAPAASYLAEIGLHLMALNTVEGGVNFTQRYHWSGIGDPTDWTSFSSGINDNLNNLGPGFGLLKLGQYGYGWHQWGIIQIQPTGVGLAPFYFTPIANSSVGAIIPHSLDHFNRDGVECAAYVGFDNVYIFNQASVIPIGDSPLDGKRRLGARSRIFADLLSTNPANAYGFVTQNIKGQIFNAYWLVIPNVRTWVYNFDENNWTPFTYTGTQTIPGKFFNPTGLRIMDLIGRIIDQNWYPAGLAVNPYDAFVIGYNNGQIAYIDFTNYSELPAQVVSGKHIFGDRRHKHTVKKFRLVVQDNGQTTYTITLTNNKGYSETQSVTLGSGTGDSLSTILGFNVGGLRIQWTCSISAGQPGAIIEFCPIFDISGEQRGGTVD
jgi:hypothetical protein